MIHCLITRRHCLSMLLGDGGVRAYVCFCLSWDVVSSLALSSPLRLVYRATRESSSIDQINANSETNIMIMPSCMMMIASRSSVFMLCPPFVLLRAKSKRHLPPIPQLKIRYFLVPFCGGQRSSLPSSISKNTVFPVFIVQ